MIVPNINYYYILTYKLREGSTNGDMTCKINQYRNGIFVYSSKYKYFSSSVLLSKIMTG